jgi:hypothetical protein
MSDEPEQREIIESQQVSLETPIAKPEDLCSACGHNPVLPGQAFCQECIGNGLILTCFCQDGKQYQFTIEP